MQFVNVHNSSFTNFLHCFANNTNIDRVMRLHIYVDGNPNLKAKYMNAALAHNNKLMGEPHFFDAGFDLFLPEKTVLSGGNGANKINFQICCSAEIHYCPSVTGPSVTGPSTTATPSTTGTSTSTSVTGFYHTGYYVHPRSSLSKTPLRLANATGIIDAGYRGNIIGMFDCFSETHICSSYDRLLQICAPSLMPIYVNVVDTMAELGENTSRGAGGFGSTGV